MKNIKELLEMDLPLFRKAYELASGVHKEQKRNDGKTPYMAHIDAVIRNTYERVKEQDGADYLYIDIYLTIAALHDAVEDQGDKINYDDIAAALEPIAYAKYDKLKSGVYAIDQIIWGVRAITKLPKGTESYVTYLLRVKSHWYARIVKLADLEHNMSDLKAGNMLDKYQLTVYLLEQGYEHGNE